MKRFMLGLLLPIMLLFSALPALAAPSVEMKAQIAGGGRVRAGGWATVLVDLTNQGAELNAELVALEDDGAPNQSAPEYVVPLTLPAGAKKRVPIDLPTMGGGHFSLSLRAGGTTIQEQTVQIMNLSPETLFAAVLSGDELGVPGLARLGGGEAAVAPQVARMDATTFPAGASLLASYEVIALSRYDSSQLSKEQVQALEAWVGRGGTLLLAGGPEWKRTFAALPPTLVPVAVSGVTEVDAAPLGALAGQPLSGKVSVSDGKVLRGQVLASAGNTPLVVVDRVGTGKVVYLAADPSLEPLVGWQGQSDLLERALSLNARTITWETGNRISMMQNALQQLAGLGLPSALVLGSLLSGYMLLVGPITYWILKRKDRREWMWITVPILSLGFVGAVYAAGYGKQFAVISHVITVTELAPGTQAATMTSYVGVYAPSKTRMDVELGNARLVRPIQIYYGGPDEQLQTRISYGDHTTVSLLGMNNYSMKGFSLEQDLSVKGGFELTGVNIDEAGRLTAQLINRLDRTVSEIQLGAGASWSQIGTLAPGQTSAPFSIDLSPSAVGPKGMPMAFRNTIAGPDVAGQRRMNVLEAIFGWEGQVPGGAVVVAGWIDQPLAAPSIPELGHTERSTNLIYTALPVPVDPSRGMVPPGVVVGARTGGPGFGRLPYGYSINRGVTTFRLTLPPIDPKQVAELRVHLQTYQSDGGWTPEVKNQQSGEWTKLDNIAVQPLPNWESYVTAAGVMEMRIDVSGHLELAAPTISVKGVTR